MYSKLSSSTLLILLSLPVGSAQSAEPVSYEATYEARAGGFTADAIRSLSKNADGEFLLRNTMDVKIAGMSIGSVDERSHFLWMQEQPVPLAYNSEQSGIGSSRENVLFNWQTNLALTTEDADSWQVGLQENTYDKLSYNVKLRQDIADAVESEFVYRVVDRDEIDEYRFSVVAKEVVSTPLGDLNSVKISRQYAQDSKRRTVIWLARDWSYLLVKLQVVNGSGTKTEMILKSASVAGVDVVGLGDQ